MQSRIISSSRPFRQMSLKKGGRAVAVPGSMIVASVMLFQSGCSEVAPPAPASAPPPAVTPVASSPVPQRQVVPSIAQAPAVDPTAEPTPEATPAPEVPETPEPAAPAEPAPGASDPAKPRKVLGKTTQDVRDAKKEKAAGAKEVKPRITGQDPISVSGSAYAAIVGRLEQLQIQDALNKFHALNERYPKDINEFMKEIINAYRIRLPQLPFYQEYGYDAAKHALVILEYPDKKKIAEGR